MIIAYNLLLYRELSYNTAIKNLCVCADESVFFNTLYFLINPLANMKAYYKLSARMEKDEKKWNAMPGTFSEFKKIKAESKKKKKKLA